MTVGNVVTDNTTVLPWYLDGSQNGTLRSGKLHTKTWSGADGLPSVSRDRGIVRTYTTIDSKGKSVKRKFRERPLKRQAFREPHTYSMTSLKYASEIGSAFVHTQYYDQVLTSWTLSADNPDLPTLPDWSANDDVKLVLKLKEKVRGSDFNLGVFLGESHQTLRMIGDSAIRIASGMKLLKRGNLIGAVHELSKTAAQVDRVRRTVRPSLWSANLRQQASSQMSNNWLELQYGWLPLLQDMRSGAKLLAHQLNVPFRKRYEARHSVANNNAMPLSNIFGAAVCYALRSKQIVAYISEPESIPKLSGLLDPELIAWELTPFSFVIDWFLPVGDFLDARAFTSSLTGLFVTSAFDRQVRRGIVGKSFDTGLINGYSTVSQPGYECSKVSLSRTVTTTLSVPMPAMVPLGKVASWQHCANALALLTQVTRHSGFNIPTRQPWWAESRTAT